MFRRLCDRIDAFLDLPPAHARGVIATLALWIILTYNHLAWDAVPYLFIGGPYGSGKTRLFEILMRLAFRPFMSSSLTGPALFRTLHERGGVLLFDEAERLKETNAPEVGEIRSMLLAGYKRGGHATRMEASGDSFRTVSFDVYGPKAIACIEGPPPALASRCIRTMMFRAAPDSMKPRRRIDADPAIWQALRDDLHAVAINHGRVWLRLAGRSKVCPEMSGRDYELWQPLLAIAAWIEDDGEDGLLQVVQQHALATIEAGREEQIPHADEILIRILASLIRNGSCPTCGEILAIAKQQEPEFFQRWTARKISSYLARYGLETVPTNGKHRYREVTVADLRKIQKNYGFDLEFGE
jgi:hypothetical protein